MVQALLARQQLEEEEERRSSGGVPVPSDISTSSALIQAMLARQRADDQDEDKHLSSSGALAQAVQARQRAEGQERDEYYNAGFSENPSAVTQAMQARQRAEEDRDDLPSSVSSVMMQVMQARQRAEEEDRTQWVPAPPQNPAPAGSSALIQAMLARQQAQNEYDDGYWPKGSDFVERGDVWWTTNDWNHTYNRLLFMLSPIDELASVHKWGDLARIALYSIFLYIQKNKVL